MRTTTEAPQIYVASLADYNAGRLHGMWLDATEHPEAIGEQVAAMLSDSREGIAEEWAIHDYSGFGPTASHLGESTSFEHVHEVARAIEEHGADVTAAYLDAWPIEESLSAKIADKLFGVYDSVEEFGWGLFEGHGHDMPDHLVSYFDAESYGRDCLMDYHSGRLDGGRIAVFCY